MGIVHFKKYLKDYMEKEKLSPRDLAEKSGLSYVAIYRYIHKDYYGGLSADSLAMLAKALGVTMDELWEGK